MAQIGIPYTLVGPNGDRAVFNDITDPDFVGYLDGDNGITGLDGPEVRESADNLVEADGGVHGNFYEGRRPITIQGLIYPEPDMSAVNSREAKLKRASRALRGDSVLSWQQSGRVRTQLSLRRQSKPTINMRRPKSFQLAMVCADYRILSAGQSSVVISASGSGAGVGFLFPLAFPLSFGAATGGAVGQAIVTNQGDAPAPMTIRIDGPIQNPTILNNTTGEKIPLIYTLGAGEFMIVNTADRSILLGGTTNRYGSFDFVNGTWWELQPGANDVRILAAGYSAPAGITVYWRDAFI